MIKKSKVVKSAIAGSGVFDIGCSAWLNGSLPEDLLAESGQGVLSFEVGALVGNVKFMMMSLTIVAGDDVSIDGLDPSFPILKIASIEGAVIKVRNSGSSES